MATPSIDSIQFATMRGRVAKLAMTIEEITPRCPIC